MVYSTKEGRRFGPLWLARKAHSGLEQLAKLHEISNYHKGASWVSDDVSQIKNMAPYRTPPSSGKSKSAGRGVTKRIYMLGGKPKVVLKKPMIERVAPRYKNRGPPGVSSGFFKKGKRKAADGYAVFGARGVNLNFESGAQIVAPEGVIVGHSTGALAMYRKALGYAITKKLMIAMGAPCGGFGVILDCTTGDTIPLKYRIAPDFNATTSTVTVTAGTTKWSDVADNIAAVLLGVTHQYQLIDISYVPVGDNVANRIRVDLTGAYVTFVVKSSLKLQNVSVGASLNVDEDAVDHAPLYGRSYDGKGCGTAVIRPGSIYANDVQLYPNDNGIIKRKFNAGSGTDITDNPLAYQLLGCKRYTKAKLDPGQLKTSNLVFKKKCSLDWFFCKYMPSLVAATKFPDTIGNFRIFSFERMLDIKSTAPDNTSVAVNYENETKIGCYITLKRSTLSAVVSSHITDT